MNRLKKKCIIATVGIHLLLLTILIVGPAFFNQQPKTDNTQVLDVIPANLIDAAFNSGVKNATPPPPQPVVQPQPPAPQPQQISQPPPAPKPVEPTPSLMARVEKYFKSEPKPTTPKTNESHTPKVDLHLVTRTAPQNTVNPRDARAIANAIRNLKSNLKSGTEINLSGSSSVAYANYASVVKSVYDAAWTLPNTIAKDENITVKVTIASDGSVISSRIVTPSGDAPADDSVQRTLDRVKFVAPFPEGSTEKERTYTIVFNPQVKQSE
jgi:TonB family protein